MRRWLARFWQSRKPRQTEYRVLHLPTTVGGNPQGLSQHLRLLGVDSRTLAVQQNTFGYRADSTLAGLNSSRLAIEWRRLVALGYVMRYQVVFFNFGRTLFAPTMSDRSEGQARHQRRWRGALLGIYRFGNACLQRIELSILQLRGAVVLVQYQGDDARQGDYCKANFSHSIAHVVEPQYYTAASDRLTRQQIRLMDRHCARIYALNPDLLRVLPPRAEFLPYSHISMTEWSPSFTQLDDRPLRVAHAPTHRGVKGTDLVIDAVEVLKARGLDFEFVLVEGLSQADAKKIYATVDVLIDQLFAGWYGGLAVELMALGKPVIAYIRAEDLELIPNAMRNDLPIIHADPECVTQVLERVLRMPREELLELALRSRAYVERWHDPISIAARIKNDIEAELGLAAEAESAHG